MTSNVARASSTPSRTLALVYRDAEDVAREVAPEDPVYCFSATALVARLDRFRVGFAGAVSFAVKSNSRPEVIRALGTAGLQLFDVASVAEMAAVAVEVPSARFNYHNPIKSRVEIARAISEFGVTRFAVDDANEIAKILEVAEPLIDVRAIELAVRFRLPKHGASVHDFSSKFGATPDEAVALLDRVAAAGAQPVITFHPGSQCADPVAFVRHIEAAARIASRAGIVLKTLNVGGGFPARYPRATAPELEVYFAAIEAAVRSSFPAGAVPALECEPGRGLVATSTSLLVKAKLRRAATAEVFLNDGIYGGLMEGHQAPNLAPSYRAIRPAGEFAANSTAFVAFGPTCDPLDRLPHLLELPADFGEGDYIEFGSLGAYGDATTTRFNGYGDCETIAVADALI